MEREIFFGRETKKAIESFGIGQTPRPLIRAFGEVKKAVIISQQQCFNLYEKDLFNKLIKTLNQIIVGELDSQFPLPLKQGGAGTSLHMNINEVISHNTNGEMLHPIDDLAKFQSTNDTFSTALIILVYRQLLEAEELVVSLQETLVKGEDIYSSVLMTGRTELQDALPITLGQVFASWAGPIERDRWRFHKLKERLRTIPLGGTAIGTSFSAPRQYIYKAEQMLRKITGIPLCRSQNLTDAISSHDTLAEVASGFKILASNIKKMCGDLLLYTSSLSGELIHREVQYGSTIMPYKSNPVLLEYTSGLSTEIKFECLKIEDYVSFGQLQLNAYLPFISEAFINVSSLVKKSISTLVDRFFPVMEVNEKKILLNLSSSPALINTLRSVIGYEKTKDLVEIIKKKSPENLDQLKKLIAENSKLTQDFLAQWFEISNLTQG